METLVIKLWKCQTVLGHSGPKGPPSRNRVNQATHVTEMDKVEHEKMFMDTKKVFKEVADEVSLLIIMEETGN